MQNWNPGLPDFQSLGSFSYPALPKDKGQLARSQVQGWAHPASKGRLRGYGYSWPSLLSFFQVLPQGQRMLLWVFFLVILTFSSGSHCSSTSPTLR